jgi:hypothetical protein
MDIYEETPYYVDGGNWPALLRKMKGNGLSIPQTLSSESATNNTNYERFFPSGSQYDAYVRIREIVAEAKTEITIVDSYIDGSLFKLLTNVSKSVKIRILTDRTRPDFLLEAKKFQAQHGHAFEVRSTSDYHDRFIIVDGDRVWHLGASIKDAGAKSFVISKMLSSTIVNVIDNINAQWSKASVNR